MLIETDKLFMGDCKSPVKRCTDCKSGTAEAAGVVNKELFWLDLVRNSNQLLRLKNDSSHFIPYSSPFTIHPSLINIRIR